MKARARYTALFERGEKYWVVQLKELAGCITQARTIEQGKERIREALSLFIGDDAAEKAEIRVETVLPAPIRKAVDRARGERERAAEAEAEAAKATERAVKAVLGIGLSTRDAGELLGLTRQRVHQVASGS